MLEQFTVSTFAPLVGSRFVMHAAPPDGLDLELVQAEAAARSQNGRPFSLVFRGPRTPIMGQRIYPLDSQALGSFEVFLVPIGPDDRGMLYEAIFT